MKFVLRFLEFTAIFLFIIMPLQLIGGVILAAYSRFRPFPRIATRESIRLPNWLKWFDCADLYTDRDYSVYLEKYIGPTWDWYTWIAWRNPLNYFAYFNLGFILDKTTIVVKSEHPTDIAIGDATGQSPGHFHIDLYQKGHNYYEYYSIIPYNFPGKGRVCFRFRMGWKLGRSSTWKDEEHVQWVFVISPVHSYDGI